MEYGAIHKDPKGYQMAELVAVVVTAVGKFIFYDLLNQRLLFIVIMFLFWGIYLYIRVRDSPGVLKAWGFRLDNFHQSLKAIFPFALLTIISCLIIGWSRGTLKIHWHMIPILFLYPLFGILQQFLLLALVTGNLQAMHKLSTIGICILTALLFALLHYPDGWLMLGTFILALFYAQLYLRMKNLFALGLFHGWLGAVYYYTVVGKDPFAEVFPFLLSI